jgi:hypothetical protein|nr:MAG: hypothetical protein [Bacteriophage sp.]
MEIPFYSAKDYTIDSVNGVCLCRCNNCGLILIDENPQVDAPKYQLKGTEENMELAPIERTQYSYSYVCPHCHCDDYLVDLQNTL